MEYLVGILLFTNLYYWVNWKRSFKLRLNLEKITLLAILDKQWSSKLRKNVCYFIRHSDYSNNDDIKKLFLETTQQVNNYASKIDSGDAVLQLTKILIDTKNSVINDDIDFSES